MVTRWLFTLLVLAVLVQRTLEARVTTGGLSTMPWTFEGRLRTLELKTLRYPGHWDKIRAFSDLLEEAQKKGLVKLEPDSKSGGYVIRPA